MPLSEKSTVLVSDGTVLAEFYYQNRIVVPNLPALDRDHMWLGKEELLTWNPHSDGAKR